MLVNFEKSTKLITRAFLAYILLLFAPCVYGKTLTLEDAISLALRKNPNIQLVNLNYLLNKYALEVQQWNFKPHYSFQASRLTTQVFSTTQDGFVTKNTSGVQLGTTLRSPIGTEFSVDFVNNLAEHYNPGLSVGIKQPLLKGFGREVVEAELSNAYDNEYIARLNIEQELRNTITSVIIAYLDLISARHSLAIDKQALARANTAISQTQKFIRSGRKAGVEMLTVRAGYADVETRLEYDKNHLSQASYTLLTTIGLDPTAKIEVSEINLDKLLSKYQPISLTLAKKLILKHDTQYLIDQITLNGTMKRALILAEDNARWDLEVGFTGSLGNQPGGGPQAGLNSIINGVNRTNSATINLAIPIDNLEAKNAIKSAKIAIKQAHIALQQEKWNIETNIANNWESMLSSRRALKFAEQAAKLQSETYRMTAQKFRFGLIDGLELQMAQQNLVYAQKTLLDNRINYLKTLVMLDNMLGKTLITWNIPTKKQIPRHEL